MPRRDRTIVYIDGFNLYYGALKGGPHRWLNPRALLGLIFPNNDIVQVKYFTARVVGRAHDVDQPIRQQQYLRALGTLPGFEIHYGHFLEKEVFMPDAADPTRRVRVIRSEEKGSDVNLAVHIVNDAHLGRFETAIIVSNDSDLVGAINIVRRDLGKTVGFLNPHRRPSRSLKDACNFMRSIRPGVLAASQFPDPVIANDGATIHRPGAWATAPSGA